MSKICLHLLFLFFGFLIGFYYKKIIHYLDHQYKQYLFKKRITKAVKKWNKDLIYIQSQTLLTENGEFKWGQLVWQEIDMYCRLGKIVDNEELDWLCQRRGFNVEMRMYLVCMLQHIGLYPSLKIKEVS